MRVQAFVFVGPSSFRVIVRPAEEQRGESGMKEMINPEQGYTTLPQASQSVLAAKMPRTDPQDASPDSTIVPLFAATLLGERDCRYSRRHDAERCARGGGAAQLRR